VRGTRKAAASGSQFCTSRPGLRRPIIGGVDAPAAESLLDLAERVSPELLGLDRKVVFAQLEERYDDLLAAMQWFLDAGRTNEAIRLARSLATFWSATGRVEEGCDWFHRVLGASGGDDLDRGIGCFEAGLLELWRGADDRSRELHEQALELGRRTGDPTVTALALTGIARIELRSDVDEARRLCREALAVTEGTDDRRGRGSAIHVLAVSAQMAGDLLEARELMTQRMELAREMGSYAGVASEAGNLSMVERQLGNLDRADALSREALEIALRREDEWFYPSLLSGLAATAVQRGELERAAMLVGAAEAMMEAQGTEWPPDERVHYDATVARLGETIGAAEAEQLRAAGRSLARDDAIELARS
jgi:MalT-like TPR region